MDLWRKYPAIPSFHQMVPLSGSLLKASVVDGWMADWMDGHARGRAVGGLLPLATDANGAALPGQKSCGRTEGTH